MRSITISCIGQYFNLKYRIRAAQVGVHATALQMRKQGIPCEVAVAILARKGQQ